MDSTILKVFNLFGKQAILNYAREGGCEYVKLCLKTRELTGRARKRENLRVRDGEFVMFVDYKRKVFSCPS